MGDDDGVLDHDLRHEVLGAPRESKAPVRIRDFIRFCGRLGTPGVATPTNSGSMVSASDVGGMCQAWFSAIFAHHPEKVKVSNLSVGLFTKAAFCQKFLSEKS